MSRPEPSTVGSKRRTWVLEGIRLQKIAFPGCQWWLNFHIFNLKIIFQQMKITLNDMREKLWNSVVFGKKYPSAWFQREMPENHVEFERVDRLSMDITTFNQVEEFWIENAKKPLNTWRVSHLKFSYYEIVFNLVGLQISVELLYKNTNTRSWSWYACIIVFAFKKFSDQYFWLQFIFRDLRTICFCYKFRNLLLIQISRSLH